MITTRSNDSEVNQHIRAFDKNLDTSHPALPSLRMPTTGFETPLSTATTTDWQGQYSFLPPVEPVFATRDYEYVRYSADSSSSRREAYGSGTNYTSRHSEIGSGWQQQYQSGSNRRSNGDESDHDNLNLKVEESPAFGLGQRCGLDRLGLRHAQAQTSPNMKSSTTHTDTSGSSTSRLDSADLHGSGTYGQKMPELMVSHEDNSLSSMLQSPDLVREPTDSESSGNGKGEDHLSVKEEDDEDLIDDEEIADGGEADAIATLAQTARERTAQRRKMKRFRWVLLLVTMHSIYHLLLTI